MSSFYNLTPEELSILATTIALELSQQKSADDLNVLGNFIVALGSLILTMAAQQQNFQQQQDNKTK